MEKLLAKKPALIKATPPASTMLADQDEARLNLERMSDDLDQASSQAWLDAQRAAERMLAKREAASLGSIPASVVTVPVVPQPVGNKTLANETPGPVANIPVKPLPVSTQYPVSTRSGNRQKRLLIVTVVKGPLLGRWDIMSK